MLKKRYLFLTIPLLLTGCSGDSSVLYKDLESRVLHTVMGFVLGEPAESQKTEEPENAEAVSDDFDGHTKMHLPTKQ